MAKKDPTPEEEEKKVPEEDDMNSGPFAKYPK